jgi:predicted transcriptional regulator
MNLNEPLISTILQLKIAKRILEVTEIKQKIYNGWIYPTEITIPLHLKYTTLESYLKKLEKKEVVQFLIHIVRGEHGSVFKVTEKGKTWLLKEIEELTL